MFSSATDLWETPQSFFDKLKELEMLEEKLIKAQQETEEIYIEK